MNIEKTNDVLQPQPTSISFGNLDFGVQETKKKSSTDVHGLLKKVFAMNL
jgi:hypothetical protein